MIYEAYSEKEESNASAKSVDLSQYCLLFENIVCINGLF